MGGDFELLGRCRAEELERRLAKKMENKSDQFEVIPHEILHKDLSDGGYCTDAIRYDPGNTWAYVLRAFRYSAYGNYAKAVEDYHQLGIPLACFVISKTAQLRRDEQVVAELSQGSKLYVTKADGEWLWARFTHGDELKGGWIHQKHVD